ncbi:MAG: (deoxy)nucleoside triphosphate pyrophosphohydrolase, partial [Candidatus Sumerlaeaceae bacterium]
KRRADDSLGGFWEFPGGKVEEGETPEAALKREFFEEFGALVEVGSFLGSNTHEYDHVIIELIGYEVSLLGAISRMDAHECMAWVPIADLEFYDLAPADEFLKGFLVENQE